MPVKARLLPPECRKSLWQGPQNAATACGKGAARDLEAGYRLTFLSEATRKALGKRPDCRKASGEGAAGQLKPGYCPQNAAKAFGKAPRMQQQLVAKAPRGMWRQATA